MKKFIFSLSALAALLLAGSCQRENLEPAQQGGTVTYTVQVPGALATKAANGYELIYEVYRQDNTLVYESNAPIAFDQTGKVELSLEFVKDQTFTVLFWAQNSGCTAYDVNDLRAVTLANNLEANDENAEAFAGKDVVTNCVSAAENGNVVLVRPIAQLNIATLTESLSLGVTGSTTSPVNPQFSEISVDGLYTSYNVATGEVLGNAAEVNFSKTQILPDADATDLYKPVGMSYVGFMPKAGDNVVVDFKIYTEKDGEITHTVSNVPVKPNYKTNIIGNLISATDNYQVTLKDWGTPDTNVQVVSVSTAQDLQEAIDNIQAGAEGNIILEGNIDLGALFGASTHSATKAGAQLPIEIPAEKTMTLDLNGFTITTPWENETAGKHYYAFNNKGTLNIVDSKVNGKIIARGIFNYGKMTLESGTIEACDGNGGYGVRNYKGAEFVMNGGTVATIYEDGDIPGDGYDATTLRVDEGATAIIEGGTINNICNYTFALDNYGTTTVNGGEFTSIHTTAANYGQLTINGGSFTCNGLEGITAHALWADAGTTTINGGTFNGKDNYNGFNVDASAGAVVNITGGEFLPVHSGSLYGDGTIIVTGGIFFDQVSSKYLEAGYGCQQNEDEKYIVKECPVKISASAYYLTLAEAVATVKEGETITILAGKTLEEGTVKLPAALKNVSFKGEEGATLKDMTIMAHDGSSISYEDLTFDGITFENSRISITGWRTNGAVVKNFTVTNCIFRNLDDNTNSAPVHINMAATEPVNGLTFTNNVIDGATGGSKSGIYAQVTGEVLVSGNIINNVAFRPYVIQVTTDDNIADDFVVTNNTFSGSAAGRAQGLGNNAEGTDEVNIAISENIFKGITDAQQICYWNFNPAKTTADLSHNYYDIDILANPGKIYFNNSAANVYDLVDMGVFPIYTDETKTTTFTPEVNAAKIGDTEYATLEEAVAAAKAGDTITVLCKVDYSEKLVLPENSSLEIKADANIKTLEAANGATIIIEDGKTLTLNNFSFGSKDTAGAEYEIAGGKVVANYGFFQHGKYALRSDFETGYMYYSYGSDITVYGTFHSQGKGDGLDYVRGKLTIAKGGKSIHDKSLWVGQPASWGAMNASLIIEAGGYVQANSLSVYEGSSLTYSNDADLKYNSVTGEEYITKK